MSWPQAIVAYVIIWWCVLFGVLPFGVRPVERGEVGHEAGAPQNPRLWFKAGVTTLVAAVIWLGFYALVMSNLISFRAP